MCGLLADLVAQLPNCTKLLGNLLLQHMRLRNALRCGIVAPDAARSISATVTADRQVKTVMQRWSAMHVTCKRSTSTLSSSSGSSKISHSAITTGICWTTLRMRKRCVPASTVSCGQTLAGPVQLEPSGQ